MATNDAPEVTADSLASHGIRAAGQWRIGGTLLFEEPINIGPYCETINSQIGAFSYCVGRNYLKNCEIGRYCSIAKGAVIGPDQHPLDGLTSSPIGFNDSNFSFYDGYTVQNHFSTQNTTFVGHDVWIGMDALIMDGIHVHTGAVIGAKAVVTRDVGPFTVVAGIPAKVIRARFDDKIISRLTSISWWNYDIRKWLSSNPNFQITPLSHESIDLIEEAISKEKLTLIKTKSNKINIINGKMTINPV